MDKEDLPLWSAKFTEVEALQYFEKTFKDYIVLNWDWDWFVVNAWLDEPEHREACLDIQVVSKTARYGHVYTASIWWEDNGLYGEI